MIYVFFADGFEEIEAIVTVDMLRRAYLRVTTVGIGGSVITGAHGIPVTCDQTDADVTPGETLTAVVLPGGMPGTRNLESSSCVQAFLSYAAQYNKFICAICAAPSILGHLQLLQGKQATCFPGFEKELYGATLSDTPVCRDDTIITANGPGAAVEFAAEIITAFQGRASAQQIKDAMQCQ